MPTTDRVPRVTRRRVATVLALFSLAGVILLLWRPWASGAGSAAEDAQYYRSAVTAVEPAVSGLDVSVQGSGSSVTVENRTGRPVVVLGYGGEPYLRLDGSGTAVNDASVSAAVDGGRVPAADAATRTPVWRHVSDRARHTWRDYRVQWTPDRRPPVVSGDAASGHRVLDWAVPMTVAGKQTLVRGAVDWTGAPRFGQFELALLLILLPILLVAVIVAARRPRPPRARRSTGSARSARSAGSARSVRSVRPGRPGVAAGGKPSGPATSHGGL